MYLSIEYVKGKGLIGNDPDSGKIFIINTGRSFTGVTKKGEKCSVISTNGIEHLQDMPSRMIIIHGEKVISNDSLIRPDEKWVIKEL